MFETIVTIGDSITWGSGATVLERSWAVLLSHMVWQHQGCEGELINLGVGGSVLHHGAPTYAISVKPCGLDVYQAHSLHKMPELMVLAHGFNDCRGGEPVDVFEPVLSDLLRSVSRVDGRMVLVCSLYYSDNYTGYPPYNRSTRDLFLAYNSVIERATRATGCIFADVWTAMNERPLLLKEDHVHPNDLGHQVIANRIFEALAQNVNLADTRSTRQR